MKLTKQRAKKNLSKLIEKFERELAAGRVQDYNEEATKMSFIQPLLEDVLGWNVRNHDEVSPEEKISRGRVDYGLKIEGIIKVFIEAKPIKADLKKHIEQAVRYGYNKKGVPFVLLTDFEGIKLFDVTVKPDSRNLLKGLKIDLQWNQYLEQFEKLWLLSKESVIKGELDKLLLVKPKDRVPVDKAILDDLKGWRQSLAKDIFKNNPGLFHSEDPDKDANYLKEINQKILDRIMFMRSCEDRGLVHRRHLKELFEERTETVGKNTMIFLREEFKHYNIIFDSDLFRPQEWEDNLAIDFKVVRDIILDTYNPYQFDVIPLEVLGNIYEQYLGYTIRVTDHQVKYELKPEVRKAGGIYYTPEYIVDYIVKNTVGKLLQELSPRKIKKMRILDPACGSGSFLIRAYEEMLNYYRNQKKKKSKLKGRQSKLELKDEETEPRLTIHEKSQILREHIFGVDLDEQAVEVTKLSLMLKMLEGEYGVVLGRAVLPMLDRNIRCGNSLISGDTLELKTYFGDDWYKVKPFNWDEEFRKIMVEEGGFDVVIGNPPYITIGGKKDTSLNNEAQSYLLSKYLCNEYKPNLFAFFFEKGFKILKNRGMVSLIVPRTFLDNFYFSKLRYFFKENGRIELLAKFNYEVFEDAVTGGSAIGIFSKKRAKGFVSVIVMNSPDEILSGNKTLIEQDSILVGENKAFSFQSPEIMALFLKIRDVGKNLDMLFSVNNGVNTGNAASLLLSDKPKNKKYRKILEGKDIQRYAIHWGGKWINYDHSLKSKIKLTDLETRQSKIDFALRDVRIFNEPKIVIRQTSDKLIGCLDNEKFISRHSTHCIVKEKGQLSIKYILGLFNSKVLNFYYQTFMPERGKAFAEVKAVYIKQIPVRMIAFSNLSDKKLHDDLVALVDVMLDLNKKMQTAKGSKKDQLQRQIDKTDREIDDLVYKLYGITKKERKIIEGSA